MRLSRIRHPTKQTFAVTLDDCYSEDEDYGRMPTNLAFDVFLGQHLTPSYLSFSAFRRALVANERVCFLFAAVAT
jgi:transposase